jgi:hypothetical protein
VNRSVFAILSFAAALASAPACRVWTQKDVEVEDGSVLFPVVRAVWNIDPKLGEVESARGDATAQRQGVDLDRAMQIAVELDVSKGSGESTQNLSGSEMISFDGVSLFGPTSVDVDFDVTFATAAARFRWPVVPTVSIDGLLGVGLDRLDIKLRDNGQSVRDTTTTMGPLVGARVNWQPIDLLGAYGKVFGYVGVVGDEVVSHLGAEVALTVSPFRQIEIFGGWRVWSYEEDRAGSDVELEMSGPIVGLQVEF